MAYISRVRRIRGVGLSLISALFLAGCGGSPVPVTEPRAQGGAAAPNRPVQDLLRDRAAKLDGRDVEGYLAALSPAARGFEEPLVRRALELPVGRFDMTLGRATISDDGSHFRDAEVTLEYRYAELPADNPFRLHLLYDLDRQPSGWVVTRAQFDRRPGVAPPPELWPSGPVAFTRSPHFLVMARPGTRGVAQLTAAAEHAYTDLVPALPLPSDERILLVLAADPREYADNFGDARSLAYAPFELGRGGPEERRIVADAAGLVVPGTVALPDSPDPLVPDALFRHELAHLALARYTRGCTSDWVAEGGAMELAGERRTDRWKALVKGGTLDRLALDPVPPARADYAFVNAAAGYLVDTYGRATFLDFYRNFKNLPESGCSGQVANVRSASDERLLRRYYRFGVTELEDRAREYMRRAAATP